MGLNTDIGNYFFFGYDAKTQARKTDNWDCIHVEGVCTADETISRVTGKRQNGTKYLHTINIRQRGYYPKCGRNVNSSTAENTDTTKIPNNLVTKWAKDLKRHCPKEDIEMSTRGMKKINAQHH